MQKNLQYDLVIIGAGAAGLMAAIESYKPLKRILIIEKMQKPALKLRITGKGRCNITNEAGLTDFIKHFGKNGRFLKYSFKEFFNTDLITYFEKLGVKFKLERGGRYFPQSDKAHEVVEALVDKVKSLNISILTKSEVTSIIKLSDENFCLDIAGAECQEIIAANVLIATGGKSYPKTGSDGTGFKLAAQLGHKITPISPSLVPLITKGETAGKLQGLSLKNVKVSVWSNGKKIDEGFGEMLFTDFGVSGPIILSLSRKIVNLIDLDELVTISIDFKPALDHKKVDQRLLKEIDENSKQIFKSLLKTLLPKKLISVFAEKLGIAEDKLLNQISSEERKKLRMLLKEFKLDVSGYKSFDQAIVTAGGVSIKEIKTKTMESRLVKGLYFAGEVIDVDADTGGYNLQAAFSTGWVAGRAIKEAM